MIWWAFMKNWTGLETIEQDEQTYRPTRVCFTGRLAALIISFILALFSIPWLSLAGRARVQADDDSAPSPKEAAPVEILIPTNLIENFQFLSPVALGTHSCGSIYPCPLAGKFRCNSLGQGNR